MREPKNQMLGTMEPPLMQLSVKVAGITPAFSWLPFLEEIAVPWK